MNINEDFKVLIGNHMLEIGQPCAVITGIEERDSGIVKGEIFYTMLDSKQNVGKKKGFIEYSAPFITPNPDGQYGFGIEELWKGYLDQDLETHIFYNSIYPAFQSSDQLYQLYRYANPLQMRESNRTALYHIKQRDSAFLPWILRSTQSRFLRDYINWIESISITVSEAKD